MLRATLSKHKRVAMRRPTESTSLLDNDGFLADFFESIDQVKGEIEELESYTDELKRFKKQRAGGIDDGSGDLSALIKQGNGCVERGRTILKRLHAENQRLSQGGSADSRTRNNVHAATAKKFLKQLEKWEKAQTDYKKVREDQVKRQARIGSCDRVCSRCGATEMRSCGIAENLFCTSKLKRAARAIALLLHASGDQR